MNQDRRSGGAGRGFWAGAAAAGLVAAGVAGGAWWWDGRAAAEGACACCPAPAPAGTGPRAEAPAHPFFRVLGSAVAGLSSVAGTPAHAAAQRDGASRVVAAGADRMIVDHENRELRISAAVTKDCSKPSVCDWGRRFQAFFGAKGGKMEPWFVFTTEVARSEIDAALQELGVRSRRALPNEEVEARKGLKPTTTPEDYLQGDPMIVTIRFVRGSEIVEVALEDLIDERIEVGGKEVQKPYTPHFVYHGSGERFGAPTGCIVCPSDCNGGIVSDNGMPLKTTENYYRVNWDRMPPVGARVEVALRSIYGPYRLSSTKG